MNLDCDVLRTRSGQVNGESKHLVTRMCAELDFAKGLRATNGAARIAVSAHGLATVRLTLETCP